MSVCQKMRDEEQILEIVLNGNDGGLVRLHGDGVFVLLTLGGPSQLV